jgi:hypothetical protein
VKLFSAIGGGEEVFPNLEYVKHESPCDFDDEQQPQQPIYRHLWQFRNKLQGTIPDELFLLTNLKSLSLLAMVHMEGTLPTYIGQLTELEAFIFTGSRVSGTLPTELGLFHKEKFRSLL